MIVVSMLDRKAGFDTIQLAINEGTASRAFAYAINNGGLPEYAPADFELYKIGEFDQKTGKLTAIFPPELICNGQDVIGK